MRLLFACLLTVLFALPFPARSVGSRAEYVGGTRGDIPSNRSGEIRVTDDTFFVFVAKHTEVKIPYERINLLEYGQKVDRRYLLAAISPIFLNAKKREHFLTVGFENDNGKQEALLFQDRERRRSCHVSGTGGTHGARNRIPR
jgi:hypothetical protein